MRKFALVAAILVASAVTAQEKDKEEPRNGKGNGAGNWTTIKGTIILNTKNAIPVMAGITPMKDKEACLANGPYAQEDMIVDAKTRAIKNVFVWIEPEANARGAAFPQNIIHPKLAKPSTPTVEIDQPCCKFIPHVLAAREGQDFVIKNSAPIPHNAKYDTENNGAGNPLIPSKGEYVIKGLKAEKLPVNLTCSIHPEMKAWIRVYDHPYYAITDEKGNFEIKLAPQGKFKMYIWQEQGGWNDGRKGAGGKVIEIKGDTMDMKEIEYTPAK